MTLSLTTRKYGADIAIVELAGRITLGRESGQIEASVLKILEEGTRKIVIDLSKVDYLDSTGIGKIAYCFGKITQSGAQARVSGARGLVMDLFKITRLDTVIKFLPDMDAACAELGGAAQAPSASAS
ncbi:MAG TPA: STAS domain-containing protein [Bryobacteraceae bacterium]|nr:STAS domain-containing protein [Bryobacteraceae bacterium]